MYYYLVFNRSSQLPTSILPLGIQKNLVKFLELKKKYSSRIGYFNVRVIKAKNIDTVKNLIKPKDDGKLMTLSKFNDKNCYKRLSNYPYKDILITQQEFDLLKQSLNRDISYEGNLIVEFYSTF